MPLFSGPLPRDHARGNVSFHASPLVPMSLTHDSANRINLAWLFRLRWGAVLGQVVTIFVADIALGIPLPLAWLAMVVLAQVVVNLGMFAWLARSKVVTPGHLTAGLAFDMVMLTLLLLLSGGPHNPFSFLYLVYVALAAVALPSRSTWGLVALAALGSALLFVLPSFPLHIHGGGEGLFNLHLQGMWVAFTVAATFIVYFVMRIRRALAAREAELELIRDAAQRNDRLSALATLAAGAAHELATPLGTIATIAHELEIALQRSAADAELIDDARLMRSQVERCRKVLQQMSADTGATMADKFEKMSLSSVFEDLTRELQEDSGSISFRWLPDSKNISVRAPRTPLRQALTNLVKNGWDACNAAGIEPAVVVETKYDKNVATIRVSDAGTGMTVAVSARAGQPFFTTKEIGQGMGLGLFVARSVAERLGGKLTIESSDGKGTTVQLTLPIAKNAP
jgi:two-component system, sensor histidine kinase RegB